MIDNETDWRLESIGKMTDSVRTMELSGLRYDERKELLVLIKRMIKLYLK